MFFCLSSASLSVQDVSLQHNPTFAISLSFQSLSFTCRKYSGEWVHFSLMTDHVATWKAVIRKTQEKSTLILKYLEFISQRTAQPIPFSVGLLRNIEDEICCLDLDVHTLNQAG